MSRPGPNNSYEDHDLEDINTSQTSKLIGDSKEIDIPFCGCLSVRYYQPYFDVDTVDIISRMSQALLYCNRETNFLNYVGDRPDAYGPIWIATTLVFIIAVSSHLNGWFTSWLNGSMWEYDFQSILSASSLIYGFLCCAPALIWFVFKNFEPKLKFVSVFCLYGYSLLVYAPAVLICLVPYGAASWVALLGATIVSTVFLLRNLAPMVLTGAGKQAAAILGGVGLLQLVLMLMLKLYFFNDVF